MAKDYRRQDRHPNLKRGGAPASAEGTRRAREAKARKAAERRARSEDTRAAIERDTEAGHLHENTRRMYMSATRAAIELYDRWLARGGEPPRAVVELSREARQLADAYRGVLEAQGATAQADEFFMRLEAALRDGAVNLGREGKPRPYIDVEEATG